MRHVMASVLVVGCLSAQTVAAQARGAGAAGKPTVGACSILTRDLVAPFAQNKKLLDLFPPEEEAMPSSASACEYGLVRLQLFPIDRAVQKRTAPGKDFQPVSGAGEAAYFRNNRNTYAELMVWTATHRFTLQVSVPTGSTAEAVKPNTIDLANKIIAKLR